MKQCCGCGNSDCEFYASKQNSDGLENICKSCKSARRIEKRLANPNYYKEMSNKSYLKRRGKKEARRKVYRSENKERILQSTRKYFLENQERLLEIRSENYDKERPVKQAYFQKNKDKIVAKRKERLKSNLNTRLSSALRSRLNHALRRAKTNKAGSAVKDLGCTIDEFKLYIESQFVEGMNWENYGLYGWHIDHKNPLSYFDLSNLDEFKKACHYTNLQPLWATDNLKKGNK